METKSLTRFNLHDIVMFTSKVGTPRKYLGVIVAVGGYNTGYNVRFYNHHKQVFEPSMQIVGSEVEWIGPMPQGTELDWDD